MKTLMFVFWIGGVGGDDVATQIALRAGAREANPLAQSAWMQHTLTIGTAAGGSWGLHELYQRKPKLAITLGIVAGAVRGGIAVHNLQVAREQGRR